MMINKEYYEEAKESLDYNPETGILTWKENRGSRARAGDKAGSVDKEIGYRVIRLSINGQSKLLRANRIAWYMTHGYIPKLIDHKNGIRDDDKIKNLRECNHQQNSRNMKSHKDSSSEFKGVSWEKLNQKWAAGIYINGKHKNLGRFENEADAAQAYNEAAKELHGDFAKLNIIQSQQTKPQKKNKN